MVIGWSREQQAIVAAQLGRSARGVVGVAALCPCGLPAVVATAPRLPDGTPFPTMFYVTCKRLNAAISRLESAGFMVEQERLLQLDQAMATAYRAAHERYLAARAALGEVDSIAGTSAGGMPDRVKCLHALAGQSLASGRDVNPVGDAALDAIGVWWGAGPCVAAPR